MYCRFSGRTVCAEHLCAVHCPVPSSAPPRTCSSCFCAVDWRASCRASRLTQIAATCARCCCRGAGAEGAEGAQRVAAHRTTPTLHYTLDLSSATQRNAVQCICRVSRAPICNVILSHLCSLNDMNHDHLGFECACLLRAHEHEGDESSSTLMYRCM